MVDYSNQKPVQNPSYIKKVPTRSQLTTGGDGGQGAALASNVNGASGQANQGTKVLPFNEETYKAPGQLFTPPISNSTPNDTLGIKNDITPTFQKGGVVGVLGKGVRDLYRDIGGPASRLGGNLIAGTTGLLFGKEAGMQQLAGTNQPPPVSITPSTTVKPTIAAAVPVQSDITKTALGQFTTPTGGFANLSISPNQPISTEGKGLRDITPEQQTYLQGQIDRNARPEVQAEFAKQAQIVNDRISANKAGDRLGQIEANFAEAQRQGSSSGIRHWGQVLQQEYANLGNIDRTKLESGLQEGASMAKLGQAASLAQQQNELEAAKANVEDTSNWQKLVASPDAQMLSKPQLVTMALQRNQPLSLDQALGSDVAKRVYEEKDPVTKRSLIEEILGPDLAQQYINSQRSQQ